MYCYTQNSSSRNMISFPFYFLILFSAESLFPPDSRFLCEYSSHIPSSIYQMRARNESKSFGFFKYWKYFFPEMFSLNKVTLTKRRRRRPSSLSASPNLATDLCEKNKRSEETPGRWASGYVQCIHTKTSSHIQFSQSHLSHFWKSFPSHSRRFGRLFARLVVYDEMAMMWHYSQQRKHKEKGIIEICPSFSSSSLFAVSRGWVGLLTGRPRREFLHTQKSSHISHLPNTSLKLQNGVLRVNVYAKTAFPWDFFKFS